MVPYLEKNRETGTNDRFLSPWVGTRLVLFIPSHPRYDLELIPSFYLRFKEELY